MSRLKVREEGPYAEPGTWALGRKQGKSGPVQGKSTRKGQRQERAGVHAGTSSHPAESKGKGKGKGERSMPH